MRVNPVYKKELKISVRTIKMAMIILAYNLVLAFIGLVAFYMTFENFRYSGVDYSDILNIYLTISIIEIGLVLFLVPAFTAGSISGEREKQTLEMLLTTKLKPVQIVVGKLEASISTILLLIFSSLPVVSIVFSVGGIKFKDLLQLVLMACVTAIFIGSIGVFFSCIFKKTVVATVFTYGAVILLTIGTVAMVVIAYLIVLLNLQSNPGSAYIEPNVGYLILICLVNPVMSLVSMITSQYGSATYLTDFLNSFGKVNPFFTDNWFVISMVVQLLLSLVFIFFAAKILNPIKQKR